jgi:hypothetical protein
MMDEDLNNMTPDRLRRLIRAKVGTRQRLNQATQNAIDATLTHGNLLFEIANEEKPKEELHNYFNFGGD